MKGPGARSLLLMVVLAGSFSFCEAQATEYFISAKPGSGSGTVADPFGLDDLLRSASKMPNFVA
jgi:hypothetical protein